MIEQAACVPYRKTETGISILLITTRKGKWTFPKGIVDPGETPQETAAKEAYEEAGVVGEIEPEVIGTFRYKKWGETIDVPVYLLAVKETLETFAESYFRDRMWLSPDEALDRIRKRMRKVLASAIEVLEGR